MKVRFLVLLSCLVAPTWAPAVTPPAGGAIWSVQSVAQEGVTDGALDFDLDRFERPHVAYIELAAELPPARRAARLRHRRFDGMVWRGETLAEFAVPASGAEAAGDGLLAIALSERTAARPRANVLFLDRAGPGPADDTVRLARSGPQGPMVELVFAGSAAAGMQLASASDDRLHAAWLDPVTGQVRHAVRSVAGVWTQAVVSLPGHVPGPPSASIRSDNRYLLGYASGGGIFLFDDAAAAPGDPTLAPIAAPVAAATAASIAVHFRSGGRIGVAWVAGAARQELRYTTGDASGFDPSTFPLLVGVAYTLPHRHALPNQEDASAVAAVVVQNANETQVSNLSGSAPTETSLEIGGFLRGLQLRGTRRYGVGYGTLEQRDVQWHQRGRAWIEAPFAGSSAQQLVAQAEDDAGSPVFLLRDSATLSIARWSEALNRFEREAIAAGLAPAGPDAAIAILGERVVVAFRDAVGVLRALERVGNGAWQASTLDAVGEAGREPQVSFAEDGRLFALHRRSSAGGDALRLVIRDGAGAVASDVVGPLAPGALANSAPRLAVVGASGDAWISHFDAAAGALQLSHRRPSGLLVAQTVAIAGQVVGERHSLRATAEGQYALAYTARTAGASATSIRYRFLRGTLLVDESVRSGAGFESVDDLHLALKNDSGELARIAYLHQGFVTGSRSVGFDARRVGAGSTAAQWGAQSFGALAGPPQRGLIALLAGAADRLLVGEGGSDPAPRLYSRTQQSDDRFDATFTPLPPVQRFGSAFACRCPGQELVGQTPLTSCRTEEVAVAPAGALPADGTLFAGLRQRFTTTPAGRYYLALWREHGDEIIRMAVSEPAQMSARLRAIGDFTPGLVAFVAGTGGAHRMDAAMLAQAREVWTGWRDRGSPALRAAMVSELARLNQLSVFEGMTFDEWFASLQVGTALDRVFADGME